MRKQVQTFTAPLVDTVRVVAIGSLSGDPGLKILGVWGFWTLGVYAFSVLKVSGYRGLRF